MAKHAKLPGQDAAVFRLFTRAVFYCLAALLFMFIYKFACVPACYNFIQPKLPIWPIPMPSPSAMAGVGCSILDKINDVLIDGLVIVLILEIILRYRESQHIEDTIVGTLEWMFAGGNEVIFAGLSEATKESLVRGSLRDTLGDEYGKVFYDQIVSAYMGKEVSYRQDFQYHIVCYADAPLSKPPSDQSPAERKFVELTKGEHIWLQQNLKFTRHGAHQNRTLSYLVARFAFTQQQLTRFIASDELFFRELIRIPDDAKELLFSIPNSEITGFVGSLFAFCAHAIDTGSPLAYSASWEREVETGDQYLEIKIVNASGAYEGSGCQIEFVLPHHRLDTEFLVTLPQPVQPNAEISFTKCNAMKSLSYIPFISTFREGTYAATCTPDVNPNKISIAITGWTFPTGGIVFTWKPDIQPKTSA